MDATLGSLRNRAVDLRTTVGELREAAAGMADGLTSVQWPVMLDKYDGLCRIFYQFTDDVERAISEIGLNCLIIQPATMPAGVDLESTLDSIPDLLRTKLDPEIEEEHAALVSSSERNESKEEINRRARMFNDYVEDIELKIADWRDTFIAGKEPPLKPVVPSADDDAIIRIIEFGDGLQ
uniref:Mediator of RNA polymerase II transcription subunit 8 n=1 Tax=Compsopogon caeruleus TaxID=31354 RepID=A0A7S1TIT7_9RHOD